MAHELLNSEYIFTRKDKKGEDVLLSVIIGYDDGKFHMVSEHQEGVFFDKEESIDRAIILADLCKEALLFIKKELGK